MTSKPPNNQGFYWQTARDSLLTANALTMFQIALRYEGEDFDEAKEKIDREYEQAFGREPSQRHGGNFSTYIRVFEEAGWMYEDKNADGTRVIRVTQSGMQVKHLLCNTPDFLKAVPYFLIELLSRYQLNNPSGPKTNRNQEIKLATQKSNIFPYWTIWKIMRSCSNKITTDELKRFVFRLYRSEDIENTIKSIQQYRTDKFNGLSDAEINANYPVPLEGAVGEPKFIMARAGTHIGKYPPLITKPDGKTYVLNSCYDKFIDEILSSKPVFQEYIDQETWFKDYGRVIPIEEEVISFSTLLEHKDSRLNYDTISDDDPIWDEVKALIDIGAKNILFVGPPGTSKTTYALNIGAKIADHFSCRFSNVQFHQSFSYEDFMQGYIPSEDSENSGNFILKDKVFLDACKRADKDKDSNILHAFVIDELNRGDPSRIFGEALTYIERRDEQFKLSSGKTAIIPRNLIIIATMNPHDKSIADIDMAMNRRFEKVIMNPSLDILLKMLIGQNNIDIDRVMLGKVVTLFKYINSELENTIGQAYFKNVVDIKSLEKIWIHRILPFLEKELRYNQEKLNSIKSFFQKNLTSENEE